MLRAVGLDVRAQAQALLGQGFGAEEITDTLLGLEPNPVGRLAAALGLGREAFPRAVVAWFLQRHGVHPGSMAFIENTWRVREGLERMLLSGTFQNWEVYDRNAVRISADSALSALPEGLVLPNWKLVIHGCPSLQNLGSLLVVDTLEIVSCPSLRQLALDHGAGDDLESAPAIHLRHCPALLSLGGLHAARVLSLGQCGGAAPLQGPITTRELCLRHCPELERLPEGIRASRLLLLEGLPRLRSLPVGMVLGGDLEIRNCERLETLPEGLQVPGDLCLENLPSIQGIPNNFRVGGTIKVRGCPAPAYGQGRPAQQRARFQNNWNQRQASGAEFRVPGLPGVGAHPRTRRFHP